MASVKLSGRVVSVVVLLIAGVLLLLGRVAQAESDGTGNPVRSGGPKAVLQIPAGARPGQLRLGVPQGTAHASVEIVKHPKLSTPLARLASAVPQLRGAIPIGQRVAPPAGFAVGALPKSIQDAVRVGRMRINDDAEVQVYVQVTEVTEGRLQQIQGVGATVELHDEKLGIVQARLPVTRLEEVAALDFVRSVRLPEYWVTNTGSVTSEGDAIVKANQVRSMFAVDGTGVRVGVISDGIAGIFDTGCTSCFGVAGGPIETGDLPEEDADGSPTIGTRDAGGVLIFSGNGLIALSHRADGDLEAGAEGTAILEIVHDIAPGAQLFFTNFGTSLEFNQAVNFLATNTDVVIDDISFIGLPYDGTSDVSTNTADALNNDTNPIRAYFTSVGNQARIHYQENFEDSSLDGDFSFGLGQTGNVHLFQATADTSDLLLFGPDPSDLVYLCGTNNFDICDGVDPVDPGTFNTVTVILVWDDVFGASGNDYDLFLTRSSTGDIVDSSTGAQDGDDDPVEVLAFTNTGDEGFFRIFIQNFNNSAAAANFDMFILSPNGPVLFPGNGENHNFNTVSSSVPAQSDAGGSPVSVVSVGAIDHLAPDDIEFFSSNGPTNDGRLKPEVSGIDGVSVTGAGGFPSTFFGTSAAAPHAAGVAALLLQTSPCLVAGSAGARPPATARALLSGVITDGAFDLGTAGPDNVFGAGRLDALAAANLAVPAADAGPNQTVSGTSSGGASVTLDGTGSSDPHSCPVTFSWSGACGSASGASPIVTCPLGVSTINLSVTNNDVTMLADSVQVTVADFSVDASPASATVTAGQSATYTVTVSPEFGAYDRTVSLTCSGTPALSTCSFSPSGFTPGGSASTATFTVTTTATRTVLGPRLNDSGSEIFYAFWLGIPGLALFGLALVGRAPRAGAVLLLLLLVASLLVIQVGCGGGGGSTLAPRVPVIIPGTPAGTSTITVNATAGSLVRSTSVSLTVQ